MRDEQCRFGFIFFHLADWLRRAMFRRITCADPDVWRSLRVRKGMKWLVYLAKWVHWPKIWWTNIVHLLMQTIVKHEGQELGQVRELKSHEWALQESTETVVVVVTVALERYPSCIAFCVSSLSEEIVEFRSSGFFPASMRKNGATCPL